jgi:hypothetical protein
MPFDRTLSIGLGLAIAPRVGFAGNGADSVAWTTRPPMVAAGAAYIRDEGTNIAETARVKRLATYQAQHRNHHKM